MPDAKELYISSALSMPYSKFKIPQLGFGVYESLGGQCVGQALKQTDVPRSEIFVTSKIFEPVGGLDGTVKSILGGVEKTDPGEGGYVDLYEEALEKVQAIGKIRAIGVSNYGIRHLEEMKSYAKAWPPALNPLCQQPEIVEYYNKHGIVVEAYCPLMRNLKANDPTLLSVAKNCGLSTAQVLIRYCLQKGWSPLPKSDNPERILANEDVYGFSISEADIKALDGLDQGATAALVMVVTN